MSLFTMMRHLLPYVIICNTQYNPSVTYKRKVKSAVKEYLVHSIVELLLLPSLVCSLYAFINEKSWRFQNTISGFSFVLFLYSIAIDAFYGKFYLIWLLQKVIRLSYNKYDYLQDEEVNRNTTCSYTHNTTLVYASHCWSSNIC